METDILGAVNHKSTLPANFVVEYFSNLVCGRQPKVNV